MKLIFGSIFAKLGIIFCSMAAVAGIAIYIGINTFTVVSDDMRSLDEERLPELMVRSSILANTGQLRGSFTDVLIADTPAAVQSGKSAALMTLAEISDLIVDDPQLAPIEEEIVRLISDLGRLSESREVDFNEGQSIARGVVELIEISAAIDNRLDEISDETYFSLFVKGADTVSMVTDTLTQLVEEDFGQLKSVLDARAKVNLLSGASLALLSSNDAGFQSILIDLSLSADAVLADAEGRLSASPVLAPVVGPIAEIRNLAAQIRDGPRFAVRIEDVISARLEAEKALASALDEIEFSLFIAAEDTKSQNSDAISNLIDVDVANIQESAALSAAIRTTVIYALETALATNTDELRLRSSELAAATDRLLSFDLSSNQVLSADVARLVAVVSEPDGIATQRGNQLEAQSAAAALARQSATLVASMEQQASLALTASLDAVAATSLGLRETAMTSQDRMVTLAIASGVAVFISFLIAFFGVVRPIGLVTNSTERLTKGDLSAMTGLQRAGGEIGRLVAALEVFRTSMIDRDRLEKEQEQARAERLRSAEQQGLVVAQLADSLGRMSEGNLDVALGEVPDEFSNLKADFNLALDKLSALFREVSTSGDNIRLSVGEISSAANELSQRTEASAASLEETALSLDQLAESVQQTARNAKSADQIGLKTKATAEEGTKIMDVSLRSMTSIEDSSKRISKAVDLIEDIAFQTNLLALNAGVEAARAGQSGQGFAVVASEVRALAQRSSQAAYEINELIRESAQVVQQGVEATSNAGKSLEEIVGAVADMSRQVSEIADAAEDQSVKIREINSAANQLDQATQQNAAMFEETTAASQALDTEANAMGEMLSAFVLPPASDEHSAGTERWAS